MTTNPFWNTYRLGEFIKFHIYNIGEACEITYWGLNERTRGVVENMFNGDL